VSGALKTKGLNGHRPSRACVRALRSPSRLKSSRGRAFFLLGGLAWRPRARPQLTDSRRPCRGLACSPGRLEPWSGSRLNEGGLESRNNIGQRLEHLVPRHADNAVACRSQHTRAPSVALTAECVPAAVDFDDQAGPASVEVCDVT